MRKPVLLGAAFSAGGAHPGSRHGAASLHQYLKRQRHALARQLRWAGVIQERTAYASLWPHGVRALTERSKRLRNKVNFLRKSSHLPIVIGGDHSCAIGTWAGIANATAKPIGLLWIDAHFDAHTPDTSVTKRLHGMPLAVLLGEGDTSLLALTKPPAISPLYCAVIGVHSFEPGEPERLQRLGVFVRTRQDIRRQGLATVLNEAWRHVAQAPGGFGVSLDLDVLEPVLAPGVSVPERGGLSPTSLIRLLYRQPYKHRLRGIEIAELNPQHDPAQRTRRLAAQLITAIFNKRP